MTANRKNLLRIIVLTTLVCCLSSCFSNKRMDLERGDISKIKVGDKVIVSTTDRSMYRFKVTEIGPDYIAGGEYRIAHKDIVRLERRKFAPLKTGVAAGGLFLAGIAIVFTTALIIFATSTN